MQSLKHAMTAAAAALSTWMKMSGEWTASQRAGAGF